MTAIEGTRTRTELLAEAARLGFQLAVVPSEPGRKGPRSPESWTVDGMRVVDVPDVRGALRLIDLASDAGQGRPHPV